MKIARAKFSSVLGVPDTELDLTAGATDAPFVITGPVGSGKTRALEAIIAAKEHVGPYGLPSQPASWLPSRGGAVELEVVLDEGERVQAGHDSGVVKVRFAKDEPSEHSVRVSRHFGSWRRDAAVCKVEYFQAGRLSDCDAWTADASDGDFVAGRLTRSRGKYGWVRSMLVSSARAEAAQTADALAERGIVLGASPANAGFAARLEKLTQRLRWLRVREAARGPACLFARSGGGEVELANLSDGERAVVLFAAAFERLGLDRSIVLIDSPELMLHPEEHTRVLDGLASMATGGQLVIATTSAAILRSAHPSRVWAIR